MAELTEQHRGLLAEYDLGPVLGATALHGGMFLRPLRVDAADGSFVLRGTRFRPTLASFEFQANAMNHAAEQGVRCPRVLRDRQGRLGQPCDGAVWAVVEYLEGDTCPWPQWVRATHDEPGFVEAIARQVASLHDVLSFAEPAGDPALSPTLPPIQFRHVDQVRQHWNESLDRLGDLPAIEAGRSRDTFMRLRSTLEEHWQWLSDEVASRRIAQLPRQIVHGDVSPVNLVFVEHGGGCGFVDWDNLHMGNRFYDALGDVLNRPPVNEPGHHRFHLGAARRYVDCYRRSVRAAVTEYELGCVRAFLLARQMEDLRQRVEALPTLPAESDAEYAALIEIRLGMMDQIRETTNEDWII